MIIIMYLKMYFFQRKDYVKYAKVFPLSKMIDFKVPAKWYRRAVGGTEVLSGVCLAFVPYSKYLTTKLTFINPLTHLYEYSNCHGTFF